MSEAKLARMANQIADFFKVYPHEQALTGIRDHIKAFWTKGMTERFLAQIAAGDTVGIDPLVLESLAPQAALSPLPASGVRARPTIPASADSICRGPATPPAPPLGKDP